MMDRERIVQLFFFAFLALIAYWMYRLLQPFLVPIAWAILLAFLFHPLLVAIEKVIKRRSVAALCLTLFVALGVILPSLWLATLLANEAQSLYWQIADLVQKGGLKEMQDFAIHTRIFTGLAKFLDRQGILLESEIPRLAMSAAKTTSDVLVSNVTGVARNMVYFVIDFFIMLMTFFYLLRDGEWYYEAVRGMTPLHEDDKRAVFDSLSTTLSSVMRGLLLTALVQGVLIGLGFVVLGVPYAVFLALATAACGLLPFGGTALVWLPASMYLLYTYGWPRAIALLIWGTLSIAVIDNIIKPAAMGQGTGLPTVALFFGIAGGLAAFGPLGLFLGPAIIAVFAALLRVYRKTYVSTRREAA